MVRGAGGRERRDGLGGLRPRIRWRSHLVRLQRFADDPAPTVGPGGVDEGTDSGADERTRSSDQHQQKADAHGSLTVPSGLTQQLPPDRRHERQCEGTAPRAPDGSITGSPSCYMTRLTRVSGKESLFLPTSMSSVFEKTLATLPVRNTPDVSSTDRVSPGLTSRFNSSNECTTCSSLD